MALRGLLWLLPLLGFCGVPVFGQVASLCRPNERFLACGSCQKTCRDPVPICTAVCRTGCYCPEDEVRNDTGECVKLSECPPMSAADLKSSEPRSTDFNCPEHEEYRSCEPCNRTCENPNPICPAQCARGCFCVGDLLRDRDGRCVKSDKCSNFIGDSDNAEPKPLPYQLTCGPHQQYRPCERCELTCSSPTPAACSSNTCKAGCFCQDGWLKAPSGLCVKPEDCPKAEESMSGGAHEVSIEDCSSDEVYLSCGWCEPSCWDPNPECPRGVCTRGCLCRPPLLRHHSGHCVEPKSCAPQKCPDPNEEYVCRYGCEARCDHQPCTIRPRRCQLGCHCKLGLLRDTNHKCVPLDKCSNTTYTSDHQDIRVNVTKNHTQFRNPVYASSVFAPSNLGSITKFVKPNGGDVSDSRHVNFFKNFLFDADRSKAKPDSTADKADPKNVNDEVIVTKFVNPSPLLFKEYVVDPFRESKDPKYFELGDLKEGTMSSKPLQKVAFEFMKEFTLDPKTGKIEAVNPRTNAEDMNKGPGFFQHLFFDPINTKERKGVNDANVFNDLMKIINQMLPQNFTPMNYTIFSQSQPQLKM